MAALGDKDVKTFSSKKKSQSKNTVPEFISMM
jgi:hypothetical protein